MKKDKKIETGKNKKSSTVVGIPDTHEDAVRADNELKRARARLMNALAGIIEDWPESRVAEALADKMMKDIQT